MTWKLCIIVAVLMACLVAVSALADKPSAVLVSALIQHESNGNDNAVGDKHLDQKAYGCLQIRKPCVDDYNSWYGTTFSAEDCLGNRALSVKICTAYIDHYATAKRIGMQPTDEDKSRIWNGGPNGYSKESTKGYWSKVRKILGV